MSLALAQSLLAVWLLLTTTADARAQTGATLTGQVVDGVSGVGLSDVRVQIQGLPASVLTDSRGQFTLRDIPAGPQIVTVSVVGFVMVRREITFGEGGSIHLVIPLTGGTGTYSERVEVTGDLFRPGEAGVPAQQVLDSADLQNLRGLVLDDPMRAMHILPGVGATDDLYSEFSVRGSDFGRIGLAVDGVPSRFLSHSVQGVEDGGSIGMINSDVLASVSLQNGSYPQRFGNRTGAQIEMTLREGSRDRAQARVALSGSSASIVGEGPIGRSRKASWLLSARKSYLDLLIKQIADNETFAFGFSDLAAKVVVDVAASASGAGQRAGRPRRARRGPARHRAQRSAGGDQSRLAGRAFVAVHAGAASHLDATRRGHRRRVLQSQPRAGGARRRTVHRHLGTLRRGGGVAPVARRRGRRIGALAGRTGDQAPRRQPGPPA